MKGLKDIVIVGRDAPLWLTALSIQRVVGRLGVQVSVIELPSRTEQPDVITCLPALKGLHDVLAIQEETLLTGADLTYAFAQRFTGWRGNAPSYLHPYDSFGVPLYTIPFLQFWLKAKRQGLDVPLEEFSLGGVAAKHGKYATVRKVTEEFSRAGAGYQLDARAYATCLRELAIRIGIRTIASPIDRVEVQEGRIVRIVLPTGQEATGDFFVDVSGPEAALLSQVEPSHNFESWSAWMPMDRILSTSIGSLTPLPGFADIRAFSAGWAGLHPLSSRTAAVIVYNQDAMSDGALVDRLPSILGQPIAGEAVVSDLAVGSRRRPWISNCVAIGEAAATVDPIACGPMALVQQGISTLIPLLPVDADTMPEMKIFNRTMGKVTQNLRDFQITKYALNDRKGDLPWDRARQASLPDSVRYKIDLFRARGGIATYEYETYLKDDWAMAFVGHGIVPSSYDPKVDHIPEPTQIKVFKDLLHTIALEVEEMPSVQAQIDLYTLPQSPLL